MITITRSKILIVDDELDILEMLKPFFEKRDYEVLTSSNGANAIKLSQLHPDIILLDINMPDIDGISVCKRIRNFVCCPIIFLTACIDDVDKVKGFLAGGDDYVVKPFSIVELEARINAHLRRDLRHSFNSKVKFEEGLTIDYHSRIISINNEIISFAKKEFDIIELLSQNAGRVFDKKYIYEQVWGYDSDGDSNVVVEHIRRIRGKLKSANIEPYVETVWGSGYRWKR